MLEAPSTTPSIPVEGTRSEASPLHTFWPRAKLSFAQLILYVFCGVPREDSLASCVEALDPSTTALGIDLEVDPSHDLSCDTTWNSLLALIKLGLFCAALFSPPCSTFTAALNDMDGGPSPLRGADPTTIYGLPGLTSRQKEKVRLGTLLAVRTAEGLWLLIQMCVPFIFEQPARRPGKPHMTLLPEFQRILDHPEVEEHTCDQCTCGAPGATLLLLFRISVGEVPLATRLGRCTHPARWWTVPWSGYTYLAPHPAIKGKQWAIGFDDWTPEMLQPREPEGDYISRSLASYPPKFNEALAKLLVASARQTSAPVIRPRPSTTATDVAADMLRPPVLKRPRLRPDSGSRHPSAGIGGLRRPTKSLEAVSPNARIIGARIHRALCNWIRQSPNTLPAVLASIGKDEHHLDEHIVRDARRVICETLGIPVTRPSAVCELHAALIAAWRAAAGDPDDLPEKWAAEGTPAGVASEIDDRGIFAPYDAQLDARSIDPADLETQANFANYNGVEEDDLVLAELQRLEGRRWLRSFDNLAETQKYLEADPVLSKIGVIVTQRLGKVKRRLVIDAKQSKVSAASRKFQRVSLPRITDVVLDLLELLWATRGLPAEDFEFFVADFADAFYHMPLDKAEQRFFVVQFRGRFYVLLRTAQGSRGAPLTWNRTGALVSRLTQAMFPPDMLRLNTYVDDPLVALRGPKSVRDINVGIVMLVWAALGFSLSLKKAKRGPTVTWTSGLFSIIPRPDDYFVVAQVKPELVQDARQMTSEFLAANVVGHKALRKLAGKASHIGSLIFALRPFAAELWAALYSTAATWAPKGCVWISQIRHTLIWLAAFFHLDDGNILTRTFSAQAMFNKCGSIEILLDASPWGLGAALIIDGQAREFIASELSTHDEEILKIEIGSCKCQQTVEALVILVAFKAWIGHFGNQRCTLRIKSDSISALHMVTNMTSKGHGSRIVARELALLFATLCHRPDVVEHIPGIANTIADKLSRKFEPGHTFVLPSLLAAATEVNVSSRDARLYLTMADPPATTTSARPANG